MTKEKAPKPNYNYDIQKLYLEMFMSDAETFVRCQNIFDPLNFDQRLQDIATFITKYVDEYKVMPEATIVNASTGSDLNPVQLPKENYDWLMNEFDYTEEDAITLGNICWGLERMPEMNDKFTGGFINSYIQAQISDLE